MSFDLATHVQALQRDGYTVIKDFLSPAVLAEVRDTLAHYLNRHSGRNGFEGLQTERVYTLVARARVFWDIALDTRILRLCDQFLMANYLLTASQAISIRSGEKAQDLHHDDSFYHLPRPRPMVSLSTIVAIDPFSERNGATRLIPASHLWDDEPLRGRRQFDTAAAHRTATDLAQHSACDATARLERLERQCIPALIPAGACLVFSGTLIHGGGANHSEAPRTALSNQYCQPWARQQENFVLAVPVPVARAMPERLQQLLGYSVHPPFIGQLTASHPAKSLAPGYVNRVVEQARQAATNLPQ
jgi:ectoine hydroxylase-related dioxygenase (phytanoyl-CoA dioxygenase family)